MVLDRPRSARTQSRRRPPGQRSYGQRYGTLGAAEVLHSAAEVWSCTIFHPSGNLRNTRVNNPCGVVPSDMVNFHEPRTKAKSWHGTWTRRPENSSFPISCPGLEYFAR